jgi:tRNA (guanine37-N1)-methyltransferase
MAVEGSHEGLRSRRYIKFKELLRGAIPDEVLKLIPNSFYIIGDIAVINLPKELGNYAAEVGRAIQLTNKNVRAVYMGGSTVSDYRIKELTHIYGEERTETIHKEYGIRIYVDISKAYFNPSLSEERRRVANSVVDNERVLDLFTGVGPFTLHIICSKKSYVVANDINPYALTYLRKSLELNKKLVRGYVDIINSDASELLKSLRGETFDKAILNLPHKAVHYLPNVLKILRVNGTAYTYIISDTPLNAAKEVDNVLSNSYRANYMIKNIVRVLDYAPHKYIYRVEVCKLPIK